MSPYDELDLNEIDALLGEDVLDDVHLGLDEDDLDEDVGRDLVAEVWRQRGLRAALEQAEIIRDTGSGRLKRGSPVFLRWRKVIRHQRRGFGQKGIRQV